MEVRNGVHPEDAKFYTTQRLRKDFLVQGLMVPGQINMVYSHIDRIIIGGIRPIKPIILQAGKEIGASFFLERREMGIINIGSPGKVTIDGHVYDLSEKDGLYIGMGARNVEFASADPANPAKFYFNSTPAHRNYPTTKISIEQARKVQLGTVEEANRRTINQYIHPAVLQSCQLVMGITVLEVGSIWNTMPCHTHDRRMEVYFYLDMPSDASVFHLMGEPNETRHIIVHNEEAVISPSWSIHSGVGTRNYTFIWGMAGENQTFDDMDHVAPDFLK